MTPTQAPAPPQARPQQLDPRANDRHRVVNLTSAGDDLGASTTRDAWLEVSEYRRACDQWAGYGPFYEEPRAWPPLAPQLLASPLVRSTVAALDEGLAVADPVWAEAVGALARAHRDLYRLAQESTRPEVAADIAQVAAIVETVADAATRRCADRADDLLERLAVGAAKLMREEDPLRAAPAPRTLPEVSRDLTRQLRLYTDDHGAIDAHTLKHVRLTRWQVARYVLARAVRLFVREPALVTADMNQLAEAIYAKMPLGRGGKAGHGNATDVSNTNRDEQFAEDPCRTVAAALRAIGVPEGAAKDAVRHAGGPKGRRSPAQKGKSKQVSRIPSA